MEFINILTFSVIVKGTMNIIHSILVTQRGLKQGFYQEGQNLNKTFDIKHSQIEIMPKQKGSFIDLVTLLHLSQYSLIPYHW